MKRISIIGSTGSIGTQTLDVVLQHPDKFKIVGLAAGRNIALLKKQIYKFKPKYASASLPFDTNDKTRVLFGKAGNKFIASFADVDIVVVATVGFSGLVPTLAAVRAGKDVAIATKEVLVVAGDLIKKLAQKTGSRILPIDSEHSAIWQCLRGNSTAAVKRLILTCSGGPFRGKLRQDLKNVSVRQALKHPTWKMGAKITIDSATLMNKGFEVIEAVRLFDVKPEQVEVIVHPQSIVHSMVEFDDGNIMAQLGPHDMRLPIQYALSYPERMTQDTVFNFSGLSLDFERPDRRTFGCLGLAYEAIRKGGTYPTVLNAANEVAVQLFLKGEIKFLEIERIIRSQLNKHKVVRNPTISDIQDIDRDVRRGLDSTVLDR